MSVDKNTQDSSESSGNTQSSDTSVNQGQTTESNPSWPSVNTSESVSAIRNDINKSDNSTPLTTKES